MCSPPCRAAAVRISTSLSREGICISQLCSELTLAVHSLCGGNVQGAKRQTGMQTELPAVRPANHKQWSDIHCACRAGMHACQLHLLAWELGCARPAAHQRHDLVCTLLTSVQMSALRGRPSRLMLRTAARACATRCPAGRQVELPGPLLARSATSMSGVLSSVADGDFCMVRLGALRCQSRFDSPPPEGSSQVVALYSRQHAMS